MKNWINVNEHLPELDDSGYSERVLVSTESKNGSKNINIAYRSKSGWHGSGSMAGVKAWMPLPEFYEEEENEQVD